LQCHVLSPPIFLTSNIPAITKPNFLSVHPSMHLFQAARPMRIIQIHDIKALNVKRWRKTGKIKVCYVLTLQFT